MDGALDLVAMGVGGGMSDMRAEETERSGERSADGFGVRAEGGDLVASGVVSGDELFEGDHHVVVIFGPGSENSQKSGAVVDGDDGLGITTDGRGGQKLEVEEYALADCSGWRR